MRFRFPLLTPKEVPVTEERRAQDAEGLQYGENEKRGVADNAHAASDDESEVVNTEFQHGVQSAQAMTQVWSMKHLVAAYIMYVSVSAGHGG